MSNHIHLIASVKTGNLASVVRDLKKFTSASIIKRLEQDIHESRREWMLDIFYKHGQQNGNNRIYQFWQQHNHSMELYCEDNSFTWQKLDYIHQNPVKAGIVDQASEYIYSSARNYIGKRGQLDIVLLEPLYDI